MTKYPALTVTELDRLLESKYKKFENQEAFSVMRYLHVFCGNRPVVQELKRYLESDEAWDLSEEAFNELKRLWEQSQL